MVIKVNRDWLKKKGIDKWFRRDNLIVLVLAGILLFIIALPVDDKGMTDKRTEDSESSMFSWAKTSQGNVSAGNKNMGSGTVESSNTGNNAEGSESMAAGNELEYVCYLETRLEKMLSGVDGVGKVSVMITLEASEELVLEKDTPVTQSSVEEKDAEGGSRITRQSEMQETTIYSTEGSNSRPYVIKRILPKVEGVLVVAEGAGSGTINKSITEIVQALFDVDAHKIKVVAMDTQ